MTPILEVRGLRVRYGAIEGVKGIALTVGQAEIVTRTGGNGAGKTTTLKSISSVLRPAAGEILFEGERTDRLPSHEVVRRGICQAPEGRRIFPRMSVKDNLEMGAYARRDTEGIGADFDRVFALFPVLRQRLRQEGNPASSARSGNDEDHPEQHDVLGAHMIGRADRGAGRLDHGRAVAGGRDLPGLVAGAAGEGLRRERRDRRGGLGSAPPEGPG